MSGGNRDGAGDAPDSPGPGAPTQPEPAEGGNDTPPPGEGSPEG